MKKLLILSFFSLLLSGCGQEEVKTVDYYKAHPKERVALLKECRNNADKGDTTNCRNASAAQAKANIEEMLN